MKRISMIISIKADKIENYKKLHAAVWPNVLAQIKNSNIHNYSIFLREPENLLFAYLEYHGINFEADMEIMAKDPRTIEWWRVTDPCQTPLSSARNNGKWSYMREVFHCD